MLVTKTIPLIMSVITSQKNTRLRYNYVYCLLLLFFLALLVQSAIQLEVRQLRGGFEKYTRIHQDINNKEHETIKEQLYSKNNLQTTNTYKGKEVFPTFRPYTPTKIFPTFRKKIRKRLRKTCSIFSHMLIFFTTLSYVKSNKSLHNSTELAPKYTTQSTIPNVNTNTPSSTSSEKLRSEILTIDSSKKPPKSSTTTLVSETVLPTGGNKTISLPFGDFYSTTTKVYDTKKPCRTSIERSSTNKVSTTIPFSANIEHFGSSSATTKAAGTMTSTSKVTNISPSSTTVTDLENSSTTIKNLYSTTALSSNGTTTSVHKSSTSTVTNTFSPVRKQPNESTTRSTIDLEFATQEPYTPSLYIHSELNSPKCPNNMTYYSHFLGLPFCYVLTELQSYPPLCPYENNVDFDSIKEIYRTFQNLSIWVPARRETKDYFGEFKYTDKSSRYLNSITVYEDPGEFILDKTCMVQQNNKLIPVSCSEKYPALCVYSYYRKTIEKFCSKRNHKLKCISTDFNLTNKCFCKIEVQVINISRTIFCKKLAEPNSFQNHLLLSQLSNKSPCWFGAEKNDNQFIWSDSRTEINYSNWKENIDFGKKFGALDYFNQRGWILENDCVLKCAICEIDVPYKQVKLHLKYSPQDTSIHVKIENIFEIHNHFANDYFLACFSDFNVNGFKFKVLSRISDFIPIKSENHTVKIKVKNNYPAYFWCETFQHPNFKHVVSNKILAYNDQGVHNHEYAAIIETTLPKDKDPFLINFHVTLTNSLVETLNVSKFINAIRPIEIIKYEPKIEHIKILFHISTMESGKSPIDEFHQLENLLNHDYIQLPKLSRGDVCLTEVTNINNVKLTWPETSIGSTAIPKELCLEETNLPVTRKCEGDFVYGGFWGEVQGSCNFNVTYTNRTLSLYDLLNLDSNSSIIHQELCNITNDQNDVLVVDVHLVVEILEKLDANGDINLQHVADTYTNMMKFDTNVLNESQSLLNSTDRALDVLDRMVSKIDLENADYLKVESRNVIIQVSSLSYTNITGIALFKNATTIPLYSDTSPQEVMDNDVILAMYLDPEGLQKIQKCKDEEIQLVLTIFSNDTLFNECSLKRLEKPHQFILSVLIVNLKCDLDNHINIIYKHLPYKSSNNSCAHWKYGLDQTHKNVQGTWEIDSTSEKVESFKEYSICRYDHTTHFAFLMASDNFYDTIDPETDLALNIITGIGCGLSLLGIFGIFVTAVVFRSWRHHSSNIINLNFSISLAAQMILLFLADYAKDSTIWCYISGGSLHYTVLSEFAWMLIIGFFQYQKFVVVFEKPISHMILKCLIVGWGVPLIPVLIVLTICTDSFQENSVGLCYPKQNCFYLGVALPVGVIVFINLFIFVMILRSVCSRKVESYGHKQNQVKLQVLLAVLLYFLLGMSWLFGLAVTFLNSFIWSYLFCLTATLQGFVMFLFFVVMNEKSRLLWSRVKSYNLMGLKNGVIWYKIFISKK